MKLHARSIAWLLPFLLTACFHKTHPSKAQPYSPPLSSVPKPSTTAVELPPSVTTIPSQPLASGEEVPQGTKPPEKHKRRLKNPPPTADNSQQAANNAQQAPAETPAVSAIGQLSTGDPSDSRQQTLTSIAATERGLNGINRTLSDQEQKTAANIREFLKQAREALASGDVEGARTLAAKAKVLLSELAGT
jgi:hypothetical protein